METAFPASQHSTFSLNRVLFVDAASCALMAIVLLLFTGDLAAYFGLPVSLLWWSGLILIPSVILMMFAATRSYTPTLLAGLIVSGNLLWVIASGVVLYLFTPTTLGITFLVGQAAFVAVVAWFEYRALRLLKFP